MGVSPPTFFSIVIPTYNRPMKLARALSSIFDQSYTSYEVIVVNDGSVDGCEFISERYSDWVRVLKNNSSRGAAAARNEGVKVASSEWVVFLDDDDEFYPDFLRNLFFRLLGAGADIGFSWASVKHQLYGSDDKPSGAIFTYFDAKYKSEGELYAQAMRVGCGYGFAVKKSSFLAVGGFDSSYRVGEDTDLIFKLLSSGYQPLVCTDVGVVVHEHNDNRLTPNFTEHAKTGVYDRLIDSHKNYISIYPQLLSRFMGWAATVYYMSGDFSRGNEILSEMLEMNRTSAMVWKKYIQVLGRRYLVTKNIKKIA